MEFRELITARRSIRKYEAAISPEDLAAILRAAQQAPSWKNQQTARSYAVVTPETLEDLRAAALPSFNRNSSANAALVVTTYVRDVVGFGDGTPVNEIGNGWHGLRYPDHGHPGRGSDPGKAQHPGERRDHVGDRGGKSRGSAGSPAAESAGGSDPLLLIPGRAP